MRNALHTRTLALADLVLALFFVLLTQTEIWVFTSDDRYSTGLRLAAGVLTLIASACIALRRTHPTIAFWINSLAVIGTILVGYPSDFYQWTNLIAIYSLGAYGAGWQRWAGLPLGVAGVLFYFARFPSEGGGPAIAAFVATLWVVSWLAGRMYGARIAEAQLRAERDLSRQLADANEERLAHEEERNRIARELHDIIGHTVNVMVVHADAGRREIARDVEVAAQAFDTIAQTGRDALSELDRVLAVLRRDESDQALLHTAGIGDLDRLCATFSDAGMDVTVAISGDADAVPVSVGLATYRIVQEALTNSLKHASAAEANVTVDIDTDALEVVVTDDGNGKVDVRPGRGLIGMRERVAVHDGSLHYGAAADGGFTISATMRWDGGT